MKDEIKKIFKGEVEDSEEALLKYSRDASVFEVRPKLVLYPLDSEDIKNLVIWVSENKEKYPDLSITPRCAGTDMSGAAIGESLILDFTKYMNKLIGGPLPLENTFGKRTDAKLRNYPLVPSYITVQPGMLYRDFEKITLEKGLILPCYAASKDLNAMGGMFGNNSAGERTLEYGQTQDYILETKMVFANGSEYVVKPLTQDELVRKMAQPNFEGEIYKNIYNLVNENREEIKRAKPKVHKNSAGYYIWNVVGGSCFDLNKLLVGSQGTLGIATEITFKLLPDRKYSKLVAIFINDLSPLGRLVDEILEFHPETLEVYDDQTMKLAVRFFPDFLRNRGLFGMVKFLWNFLPEFKMMLWDSFPKMVLLAEFAGESETSIDNRCRALKKRIKDFKVQIHVTKSQSEADKYWDIRRESFSLLRKHVKGLHTAPFIDDIIVRPEFLPKFLPELNSILKKYDLIYTIAGHAGDGNFHIIPMMDFSRPDTGKVILELGELVYDLVLRYHGSIAAEHNDGLIRTSYLPKMYGREMVGIFKEIKKVFDPKNIFNPGKKVPVKSGAGTREYIAAHIAAEHTTDYRI